MIYRNNFIKFLNKYFYYRMETTCNVESGEDDPLDAYMAEISQKARSGGEVYKLFLFL